MKNLLVISFIVLALFACKKTEFSPEGPTDVRVRNLSDVTFGSVIVNTSGGIDTLGDIAAGAESDYFRFEKAFPKAEIKAVVNQDTFYTGDVDFTYMQYIGQDKITYEVYISNMTNKVLTISNVVLDGPIELK